MGRKRIKKVGTLDRIGEEVSLDKCPECREHSDCFSCMEGRCTALKVSGGQGCVFYKPASAAKEENRGAYRRLKEQGRYDIIEKYMKALTSLGVFDEELEEADRYISELEEFSTADFEKALEEGREEWTR